MLMILTLMYHRVSKTGIDNDVELFERHIETIANQFTNVIPGETSIGQQSVCLTFDDAYYDFYHYVYPLLKKFDLKALLAIPTQYILTSTSVDPTTRLSVPINQAMNADYYRQQAPFCSWEEIIEMTASKHVIPASHSHSHADLSQQFDYATEITQANNLIQYHTGLKPTTFIYPYGNMNKASQERLTQDYDYIMRIGSALNYGWQQKNNLIYRVDADRYWHQGKNWGLPDQLKQSLKYFTNQWRGK